MKEFPEEHHVTNALIDGIAPYIGKLAISFALMEDAITAMVSVLTDGRPEGGKRTFETKIGIIKDASSHPAFAQIKHFADAVSEAKGLAKHRGRLVHWAITEYVPASDKCIFTAVDYEAHHLSPKSAEYTQLEIVSFAARCEVVTHVMLDAAMALADYDTA